MASFSIFKKSHILDDALAILLGLGIFGGAALGGWFLMQHLGLGFSYTGLSRHEIDRIVKKMYSEHDLLSSVTDGSTYSRGIFWDHGGFPVYYRHEYGGDDGMLTLYPMLWNQTWSTSQFQLAHPGERLKFPLEEDMKGEGRYGY